MPRQIHGMKTSPEYSTRSHMIQRCNNPNDKNYDSYGGRGIRVCQRWLDSFEDFYSDVGPKPSPLHSLDRWPDNNGNYEPGNVRWATYEQQMNNTRRNINLSVNGRTRTVAQWARKMGVDPFLIYTRLKSGLPVEYLLTGAEQPDALVKYRRKKNERTFEFQGQIKNISEWASVIGISRGEMGTRLKHWPLSQALTQPSLRKTSPDLSKDAIVLLKNGWKRVEVKPSVSFWKDPESTFSDCVYTKEQAVEIHRSRHRAKIRGAPAGRECSVCGKNWGRRRIDGDWFCHSCRKKRETKNIIGDQCSQK